jgi:hypothetical protein
MTRGLRAYFYSNLGGTLITSGSSDNTYTWEDAFAVHVAGLNMANFADHNDWCLLNISRAAL